MVVGDLHSVRGVCQSRRRNRVPRRMMTLGAFRRNGATATQPEYNTPPANSRTRCDKFAKSRTTPAGIVAPTKNAQSRKSSFPMEPIADARGGLTPSAVRTLMLGK